MQEPLPNPGRRFQAPPAPESQLLRVVAIAMLFIAGLSLLQSMMQQGVNDSKFLEKFGKALEKAPNESSRASGQMLAKMLDYKQSMEKDLRKRLPSSEYHGKANEVVEFLTSVLLIASGVYLLQRNPVGRTIGFAYAGVSLVQKVVNMVYLVQYEVPIRQKYLELLQKLHPEDAQWLKSLIEEYSKGAFNQLVASIFPIVVLAVLLHPSTQTYFQRPIAPPPEPPMPPPPGEGMPMPSVQDIENLLRQRLGKSE